LPKFSFRPRDDATMTRTFRKRISKRCATDDAQKRFLTPAVSDSRSVMKPRNSFVVAAALRAGSPHSNQETIAGAARR
jgi:hypothetical protein